MDSEVAAEPQVVLGRADAQRVFDVVVGANNASSGFMESADVAAMRRWAAALGVDPAVCTDEEFVAQFPHEFVAGRADLDWYRLRLPVESDADVLARLGARPEESCDVGGRWRGRCSKRQDDPVHRQPAGRACQDRRRHVPHTWFGAAESGGVVAIRAWWCDGVRPVVLAAGDHTRLETVRCYGGGEASWCYAVVVFEEPFDMWVGERLAELGWRAVESRAGSSAERAWRCGVHAQAEGGGS